MKRISLSQTVPSYKDLLYKSFFAGENIYGRGGVRRDSVNFVHDGCKKVGLTEAIFSYACYIRFPESYRIVLTKSLCTDELFDSSLAVVDVSGHNRYKYCMSDQNIAHIVLLDSISFL